MQTPTKQTITQQQQRSTSTSTSPNNRFETPQRRIFPTHSTTSSSTSSSPSNHQHVVLTPSKRSIKTTTHHSMTSSASSSNKNASSSSLAARVVRSTSTSSLAELFLGTSNTINDNNENAGSRNMFTTPSPVDNIIFPNMNSSNNNNISSEARRNESSSSTANDDENDEDDEHLLFCTIEERWYDVAAHKTWCREKKLSSSSADNDNSVPKENQSPSGDNYYAPIESLSHLLFDPQDDFNFNNPSDMNNNNETFIPIGTTISSLTSQLLVVGFGFALNLVALMVFLPGLSVPRRARIFMAVGACLNLIVAWHWIFRAEMDIVV